MKRIITYILLTAVLAGCGKTADVPQPSVALTSSFEGASVSGGTLSIAVPSAGAAVEVDVDCNWTWDFAVQSGSWYAVEATDRGLLIYVPENALGGERTGIIAVRASNGAGIAEGYVKIAQDKAADTDLVVELQGEDTEILLPADGGGYDVKVTASREWSVKAGADWIDISKSDDGFRIEAERYASSSVRSTEIAVATGEGESFKTVTIIVSQLPAVEPMVIELTTDKTSSRMGVLPFGDGGMVNCIVDWGDGRIQKVSSPWPQHFYFDDGVYEIKILGKVACIDSDSENFPAKFSRCITAVKNWGEVGLESLENAFAGCNRLKSVAAPGENAFAEVRSVDGMFRNCVALTDIPEGLFSGIRGLAGARDVFSGCTSLKSVPGDIFDGCTAIEDFSGLFEGCSSLGGIPSEIFDSCKNIRIISRAFFGCSAMKGESPYTIVGGKKIHLYERDGSDALSRISEYASCFGGCTGLDDYGTISSDYPGWK